MIDQGGITCGAVLRTTKYAESPIFISNGHKCSLETAVDIVRLTLDKYRIPEPLRQADKRSRIKVRELYDKDYYDW